MRRNYGKRAWLGGMQSRLILALERARSCLAIAFAAENKRAPLVRWEHYVETDNRLRRYLRRLRSAQAPAWDQPSGQRALEALEALPLLLSSEAPAGTAMIVYRDIHGAVDILELLLEAGAEPATAAKVRLGGASDAYSAGAAGDSQIRKHS